ncbi:MAG: hypothetical protein NDI82_11400, partial [Anaeromyxobacteraceae bacterium]|nr:hypothetical protein [Anaeromyxobacteraceae bacterium]
MDTAERTPASERPDTPGPGAPRRRLRLGLGLKVLVIAAASTALVTLILAVSFVRETRAMLEQELTSRGRLVALSLANTSANLIFAQDTTGLESLAAASLADVPGAAYVVIRDEVGGVLAAATQPELGGARPEAVDLSSADLGARLVERTVRVAGREMLHIVGRVSVRAKSQAQYLDPLGLGGGAGAGAAGVKQLGSVEVGFARADLLGQIAAASRRSVGLAALAFLACLA